MDLKYKDNSGLEWIIPNVRAYRVVKTQAARRDQFAPLALPPKPNGQGGQTEYLLQSGADLSLWRQLNPTSAVQKWLWGHETSGWIAWVEKRDVLRIEKANKKLPRRQRVPLWEAARLICWPAIALTGNLVYVKGDPTRNGWGEVVGIPADADMALINQEDYPGWIHTAYNPKGDLILRDGQPAKMPLMSRTGRAGKAKGGLWIDMTALELVE